MAYRQPRVPEYRESEDVKGYMRPLILFLREFTTSAWRANNQRIREIEAVRRDIPEMPEIPEIPEVNYPVTSVNGKTGDVALTAQDVGALSKEEAAADSGRFSGRTWAEAMLELHPVGSVYLSVSETSPASLFGGTWEQLQNRFLIGAGGSYGVGATGGAATHTLTVSEMPSHTHPIQGWWRTCNSGSNHVISRYVVSGDPYEYGSIQYTGGNVAHNNMPPYLSVYMWKRTA